MKVLILLAAFLLFLGCPTDTDTGSNGGPEGNSNNDPRLVGAWSNIKEFSGVWRDTISEDRIKYFDHECLATETLCLWSINVYNGSKSYTVVRPDTVHSLSRWIELGGSGSFYSAINNVIVDSLSGISRDYHFLGDTLVYGKPPVIGEYTTLDYYIKYEDFQL